MASSQASWMYTDPYAYQYSDLEPEHDTCAVSSGQQTVTNSSNPCELEGSAPQDTTCYELATNPPSTTLRDSHQIPSELDGLSNSRPSPSRTSPIHSDRRGLARTASRHAASGQYVSKTPPRQPDNSGLISVLHDAAAPIQHYVPHSAAPRQRVRPSPPHYDVGLIAVDENTSTPKEPSSDFDTILRNIGPIYKKGKGNTGRERGSRYYDRYSSNFG
ncbi:hypothetical protein NUW58_g9416 [Xylaria curta]|uniref:Uncharacterized protein n=1 Tax=Xylaria curta TaxID=42375 RepID=A0ACC1MYZ6_9PEZI|nr:hypothetical protein NUW58_g9416 [Xylaria curta]